MATSKKKATTRKQAASKKEVTSDTAAAMSERKLFGPTWSTVEKAKLAQHVVNLRAGKFTASGDYETTSDDVRRIFDQHLPAELDKAKNEGRKLRVLFWEHGGLGKEKSALQYAMDHIDAWKSVGIYPIFFVWETGLKTSIKDILVGRQREFGERGFTDKTDKFLERRLHRAVEAVWSKMKEYAHLAAQPDGGARFTAGELAKFAGTAGNAAEFYACGHSAGSIFHAHFLPRVAAAGGPAIRDLFLLAPAITIDLFKQQLTGQIGAGKGIDHITMFTMDRVTEKDDNVAKIYRKSLLYFVMNACEPTVPTPILGLEDSLENDSSMERLFGIGAPSSSGEIVWSPGSQAGSGIHTSNSTTHGGFDNDKDTLNSLARRITGDHSITPFVKTRGLEYAAIAGRRRAVCIGIDDYLTSPLSGCVNDANLWRDTLIALGYDTRLITNGEATRRGMLEALGELVGSSRPGDSLVFQYAGHGTQVVDVSGDEEHDGLDEALVPADYQDGEFLIDDDIGEVLDNLPDGVSLTCFMDCCNSGSNTRALFGRSDNRPESGEKIRFLKVPEAVMRKHVAKRLATRGGSPQNPFDKKPEVLFAACEPHQTAKEAGGNGYFTIAATSLLRSGAGQITNSEFLSAIHQRFENPPPHAQDPVLDCDAALKEAPLLFSESRNVVELPDEITPVREPTAAVTPAVESTDARLIIETMHDYMQTIKRLL